MSLIAVLLIVRLASGAPAVPSLPAVVKDPYPKPAALVPDRLAATSYNESFRITLAGDPFTASPFVEEKIGFIPVGRWLNAVQQKKVQYGAQLVLQIENCSGYGCTIETDDNRRVIIAKRGVSDAIRLDIYDEGWTKNGTTAISDDGQVAVPVVSPQGNAEVWIIRQNGRMRKRIPFTAVGPVFMRWFASGFYMILSGTGGMSAGMVSPVSGTIEKTDLLEAFWPRCAGDEHGTEPRPPVATGLVGGNSDRLQGLTAIPVFRRGDPAPGTLELTRAARPMTASGFTSPGLVEFDCQGRIIVVSANSDAIWCLRFGQDGKLLNAQRIISNIAGDYRSIRTDPRGRFYYLEAEMTADNPPEATRINLVRLR